MEVRQGALVQQWKNLDILPGGGIDIAALQTYRDFNVLINYNKIRGKYNKNEKEKYAVF